jgi:RNA polymerase sigma-70 factor (ECF subfamily)
VSQSAVLELIQSGDLRRAASTLVVSYGSDVLATCIAMVRDRVAAEDITQEVFSDAIRALSTFRGDSSPRTWLLSITRNRCIDYLRARKRDAWEGATDEGATDPDEMPDQGAFGSEWFADRSVVLRALDTLAEGDRALIVLRFKNGLEYDELATAFGLREGTVRMRVSRALARMRSTIESDRAAVPAQLGAPGAPPPARAAAPPSAAAPAQAAQRARAAAGAPVVSWWTRLLDWAGGGHGEGPIAPPAPPSAPVGTLGLALHACESSTPSEALAARLGALVDRLP